MVTEKGIAIPVICFARFAITTPPVDGVTAVIRPCSSVRSAQHKTVIDEDNVPCGEWVVAHNLHPECLANPLWVVRYAE